ncbi:hypothetical protein [Amycolatopsis sp. GA6-003]|uniref:hypothetical protein n=1 Tax=Amycolatopsis sp. GA6-003 TaxID=2652444 RepID=UPI003917590B
MPTFALNCSRAGAQVVAQYYYFLRLGRDGYRRIQQYCRDVATDLAELGPFRLLTDGGQLPVFAFMLKEIETGYSAFNVSAALREQGWHIPALQFSAHREDLAVLRIVVRNGFSHDFVETLRLALPRLRGQDKPQRGKEAATFSHQADTRDTPGESWP